MYTIKQRMEQSRNLKLPAWGYKCAVGILLWYLIRFFLRAKLEVLKLREIMIAGHTHPVAVGH